jgi:hypothetical protein
MVPVGSGRLDCYTDLISREAAADFRPHVAADSRVAESRDDDRFRLRTHCRDRAPGLGIVGVLGPLSLIAQRGVAPTAEAEYQLMPERACRIGPTSEPRDQRRE